MGYGPTECFVWELYRVHAEEMTQHWHSGETVFHIIGYVKSEYHMHRKSHANPLHGDRVHV